MQQQNCLQFFSDYINEDRSFKTTNDKGYFSFIRTLKNSKDDMQRHCKWASVQLSHSNKIQPVTKFFSSLLVKVMASFSQFSRVGNGSVNIICNTFSVRIGINFNAGFFPNLRVPNFHNNLFLRIYNMKIWKYFYHFYHVKMWHVKSNIVPGK